MKRTERSALVVEESAWEEGEPEEEAEPAPFDDGLDWVAVEFFPEGGEGEACLLLVDAEGVGEGAGAEAEGACVEGAGEGGGGGLEADGEV